jgi:hypothetical protein
MQNKKGELIEQKILRKILFSEATPEKDFIFAKADEILTITQNTLDKALIGLYTNFAEQKLEAVHPEDLHSLSRGGATIFADFRRNVAMDPRFKLLILKLAAFCFFYSPSPDIPLERYFNAQENFIASIGIENYWDSYFFFLKYLLAEESIRQEKRLSFLAGVLKFAETNRYNLTDIFFEKLLSILDLAHTKKLVESKPLDFSLDLYNPNYTLLFEATSTFWEEMTIPENDKIIWKVTLKERLGHMIAAEKKFMETHNLVPHHFFENEIKKLIVFLPDVLDNLKPDAAKKIIGKITRFNMQHILFKYFSMPKLREKMFAITKTSDELAKEMIEEEETEKKAYEKAKILKIKQQVTQRNIFKKKQKKKKTIKHHIEQSEKEFNDFFTDLNSFAKKLSSSTHYIFQLQHTEKNTKKLEQQFKSEFGQVCALLERIYRLLNFEKPNFIENSTIYAHLEGIATGTTKFKNVDNGKKIALSQKIEEIKSCLQNAELDKDKQIENLVAKLQSLDNVQHSTASALASLSDDNKIQSEEESKTIDVCQRKIENLAREFHALEATFKKFNSIVPVANSIMHQLKDALQNINSLERLFRGLTKTTAKPAMEKDIFKEAKSQNEALNIGFIREKAVDWEKRFKSCFFETLSVLHRIPYVTAAQGRRKLVEIFIKQIHRYKEKIQETEQQFISLKKECAESLKQDKTLIIHTNKKIRDEKIELKYLNNQMDAILLILEDYKSAEKELYQMEKHQKIAFEKQLELFETSVRQLKKIENALLDSKCNLFQAFPENAELNAENDVYAKQRTKLIEKRRELNTLSEELQRIFKTGQANSNTAAEMCMNHVHIPLIPIVPVGFFFASFVPATTQMPSVNIMRKLCQQKT